MNKTSLFAVLTLLLNTTSVFACPDLNGEYMVSDGHYLRFEQTACSQLIRSLGKIDSTGQIHYQVDRIFNLDGTQVCNDYKACESFVALSSVIKVNLNFNGGVRTEEHGLCNHKEYTLLINEDGSLGSTFKVFDCADSFKGSVTKVFQRK